MNPADGTPAAGLAIGDVAAATGLSVETLRIWERRYGRPKGERLPSGHRRYSEDDVRWLRRVAEAIALGFRPSRVVPLPEAELDAALREKAPEAPVSPAVASILEAVGRFDRGTAQAILLEQHARLGSIAFIETVTTPLVRRIGRSWADGGIAIRHEHFASEIIEDVLRMLRLQAKPGPVTPAIVLSTLPGEEHDLGLQGVALALASMGLSTVILGRATPLHEIVKAVAECEARVVVISISLATGGVATDRQLADLRRDLPPHVHLAVGGQGARGARRGPRGIVRAKDLDHFCAWLKAQVLAPPKPAARSAGEKKRREPKSAGA